LLMESNHDREMLLRGRYPQSVKQRIAGNLGHLSNEQAADFLSQVAHRELKVVIGHVSEENNHQDLLQRTFSGFHNMLSHLDYATQTDGASWLDGGSGNSACADVASAL